MKRLRPAIGRDDGREVGELLRLKRQELIASLCHLKGASRALALTDQRRHLRSIGIDVADNAGLDTHGVLQAADGILPARPGIGDELLVRGGQRDIGVLLLEGPIDLLNVEGDVLGLVEQLLRPLYGLLKLLERGKRQARQIAGLVDQHRRLVLERGDLVVDLLQRSGRLKNILRVVARIEDDDGVRRRGEQRRQRHRHRKDG